MSYTESLPVGRAVEQAHLRSGTAELYRLGDAVRVFAVRSPSKTLDDGYALYHPDIPSIGSAHPSRAGIYLLSKVARQADERNGLIWEVTCNYGRGDGALLPWFEPPVYAWGSQATEQVCDWDIETRKPIRNSAGAPFDPGVTATRYEAVLTVSRNQLSYDASTALQYTGAVNSSPFYGAPRGFCMCTGIPASSQIHVGESGVRTQYWAVQFTFAFRNQWSWQPKVMDAGYCRKPTSEDAESTLDLIPITMQDGRELSSPALLDGEGQPLKPAATADPVFLDFKVYPEVNFSSLGI